MKISDLIDALKDEEGPSDDKEIVLVLGDDEYCYDFDIYEFQHPQLGWVIGIEPNK